MWMGRQRRGKSDNQRGVRFTKTLVEFSKVSLIDEAGTALPRDLFRKDRICISGESGGAKHARDFRELPDCMTFSVIPAKAGIR